MSAEAAQAELLRVAAAAPATFKMIHQVSARYGTEQHGMTGYLLGRKDGSFRVSAAVSIGPRLFDVAKVDGRWETKIHLAQLKDRLDPKHIGRAVERVYFLDAPPQAPVSLEGGYWIQRASLTGDEELDSVESWRAGRTLALLRKRFSSGAKGGQQVVTVDYRELDPSGIARSVRLKDSRGFELQLRLTQYVPGFQFPPERLHLN